MRAFPWVVMLFALLALSCASRPLPHHPQPEDGRRAEIRRATYALLGAVSDADTPRIQAYFAPEWQLKVGDAPLQSRTPPDAPRWFSSTFSDPLSAGTRLERRLSDDGPRIVVPHDLRDGTVSLAPAFTDSAKKLTRGRVLAVVSFTDREDAIPQGELLLLWAPAPFGWAIHALDWQPTGDTTQSGAGAPVHEE